MSEKTNERSMSEFEIVARELGCDPDDPRVAEVLKAMAKQPPQPHGNGDSEKQKTKPEKRAKKAHADNS